VQLTIVAKLAKSMPINNTRKLESLLC